ncbi:MAG: HD-GYP domain-containing protein [Dehalococcoidia bacterium]|nr:MAG: HD-GYP domain-containing protein [Dehalococcoidia bacterium]
MSGNDHHHAHAAESIERLERVSARRVNSRNPLPQKVRKWLWLVGVITTMASITVLLMGREPSLFNYLATFVLLGSMGLLAFVSASRALNFSARYEESILYVEEVKRSYLSLRQVVTTAMDLRDDVTGGHSDRVVGLSLELARRLGLAEEHLHHLEWAAFLHDIGKVRIDEGILTKPGPLDAGEWGAMQQHPYFSYSILAEVDSLREAAEIVYCHHERYDGMGYPRSLRGAEIPLEARIFSVADAYDAMVSPRPYRQTLSHEQAVQEVLRHAGTQFDPQVVAAFGQWTASLGGESARRVVEEEAERLPIGLPQPDRTRWM